MLPTKRTEFKIQ